MPTVEVVVGFVGVLVGTAATSILTIYRERFTARREREARDAQSARERREKRDGFQRESLLALQQAVADLVRSVYDEQDRMLVVLDESGRWPVRTWETVTAKGWSDAEHRLELLSARVFDAHVTDLAAAIRENGRNSVWAQTTSDAKASNVALQGLVKDFNSRVRMLLPGLYGL